MALVDLSIRRPVFAWMLMVGLILFGYVSFRSLGISQLPDVDFPVVAINVTYPGASPEVMEASVVDPVEDAVTSIEGVRRVTSSSITGSATVTVEFDLGRNIDLALQDVQARVEQARRNIPTDVDPPIITKTNPEDQPILWLALQSDRYPVKVLSRYVQDTLKGQFATIPGVGDIRLGGFQEPNLRVWVDPRKLNPLELTITDVANAIREEHIEPPSGYLEYGKEELNVRTLGEADRVESFGRISINSRGGLPNFRPFALSEVATIEAGLEDIRRIARSNGKSAVGLGIQKQRGSNAVAVAQGVRAKLEQVRKALPAGMTLEVRSDTTRFIEESVDELIFTLVMAALLTALVCWAFLGSWSATLNVLLAIPTSVVGAFTALYFSGFTLNVFTLLALSLSIGIVVDDAIMVLENITRRRELGEGKVKAALLGARQITFAATAATVSILAIFLPVIFMKGIIGKYFLQFGVTLSVAVILSLVEALTITPMRCAQFLEIQQRRTRFGQAIEGAFEALKRAYGVTLGIALRHRALVLTGAALIFAASLSCVKFLKQEFLPEEDQSQFLIRVRLPEGASLGATDQSMQEMEKALLANPAVQGYFASVGGFTGAVNQGFIFVVLKPKGKRGVAPGFAHEPSQGDLIQWVRKTFDRGKERQVFAQDLSARGFSASRGFPVEFTLIGPDWKKLSALAPEVREELRSSGLVVDVDSDYEEPTPELAVIPDRTRAEARGVPVAAIADTVGAALGGIVVGRYTESGRRYDIRVKAIERPGLSPRDRVKELTVRNNRGEIVPLLDVIRVERQPAPKTLNRLNRQRAITFFANVAPGKSQSDALAFVQRLGAGLPEGYRIEISGTAETFKESFSSLVFALGLGILVAYMVLATQFNSFSDPVSVLSALPFSVSGAFVFLLLFGQSINIYSMIGLLLLMGIVKKNSILLVEFTNQVRAHEHRSKSEALTVACPVRLRPILMTTIATIVGAVPAAIAFGPGAEARRPMAIAIIGGLVLSSFLTLYVVPCLYSLISPKEKRERDLEEIVNEAA